jgi:hypothetical protein
MKIQGRRRLHSSRSRSRRVDRAFLRVMQALLVVFFLFTLTSMLSKHEPVQIRNIHISGAEATSVAQAKSTVEALLGNPFMGRIMRNNIIFYPKNDIIRALYEIDAHIEYVSVEVGPHTELNIAIKEFTPELLWCARNDDALATSSESCFLADKNGYIYSRAPLYSGYPFFIFRTDIAGADEEGSPVGLRILPEEEFSSIAEFRRVLQREKIFAQEVSHSVEQDYNFVTDDGWHILWSTKRDAKESTGNLSAALLEMHGREKAKGSSTPKIIDLRFEDKIFYQ